MASNEKTFLDEIICDISRRGGHHIGSRAWGAKVTESSDWDYIVPLSKAGNLIETVSRWEKDESTGVCYLCRVQEEGIPSITFNVYPKEGPDRRIHIRILPDDLFVAWHYASSMMHAFPSTDYPTREARLFMFKNLVNFFRFWKTNA